MGSVLLDPCEKVQSGAWARAVPLGLQAHAHDTVEGQGHEADQRMRTDAIRQSVMNRRDLDVGFQYAKAPLDIP